MSLQDRLPSLAVLRCFEAAAQYQSYTGAAEVLNLTQSAVSRQVKELEDYVGAPLFRREGRGVRLTEAGKALADELSGDLDRLRRTLNHAVAAGSGPKALTIGAPPTFAARWLVPKLPSFRALHDEVQLVLYSRSEPFDLISEKVDVAVHFGGWDWPGAQLTPLCPEDLVAVAAPQLVTQHPIEGPEDILGMPLLHLTSRAYLWEQFAKTQGQAFAGRQGCTFDQISLVIEAAAVGMGAAILPTYLIEQELAAGKLTKLADVTSNSANSYFVATPMGQSTELTHSFTAWLRKQVVRRDGGETIV